MAPPNAPQPTAADDVVLLCVGDLHVGRAPSGIPDAALAGSGVDRRELTPAAAWLRLVDEAIARGVDAVVLLGDVVDEDNALLEALGPFGRGVARLAAAGVPVVAVAGNHDVDALPRLVDATDGIELLGRGGTWQSRVVRARSGSGSGAAVRLVGWSFPARQHRASPLDALPAAVRAGAWEDGAGAVPTIGLLHADLDATDTPYAPVRRAALAAVDFDAWLLGHVHVPDASALGAARPIGYLGSVVGLDPGEPGGRGAWLARCSAARGVRMERVPVAWHRYEPVPLDVGALPGPDALVAALVDAARRVHADVRGALAGERVLVGRLVLEGASEHHAGIVAELERLGRIGDSWLDVDGVLHVWEQRVVDRARSVLDLDALAASTDVAAPLARLARDLEGGGAGVDPALLGALREHLRTSVLAKAAWRDADGIAAADLDDGALERLVAEALPVALAAIEEHREARG